MLGGWAWAEGTKNVLAAMSDTIAAPTRADLYTVVWDSIGLIFLVQPLMGAGGSVVLAPVTGDCTSYSTGLTI